jgi:hypothetical protein
MLKVWLREIACVAVIGLSLFLASYFAGYGWIFVGVFGALYLA